VLEAHPFEVHLFEALWSLVAVSLAWHARCDWQSQASKSPCWRRGASWVAEQPASLTRALVKYSTIANTS
jgi:hypothetical protein